MTTKNITELRRHAEEMALADYKKAVGSIITVTMISGYNDRDDSVDIDGIPIEVRILATPEDDIYHWVDEYLDPYWNVEPVSECAELAGLRSFWTFGPSYRIVDGQVVSAEQARADAKS